MPLLPLNRTNLPIFRERLQSLREEDLPQWGKLTPAKLMRHLSLMVEISLGEITKRDMSNVLTRTLVKWVFFHLWTRWPKGNIKGPPEFTPEPEGNLEAERARLLGALERYVNLAETEPTRRTSHPIFGPISLAYWGHIHGVHFNHHFRQYGRVP